MQTEMNNYQMCVIKTHTAIASKEKARGTIPLGELKTAGK